MDVCSRADAMSVMAMTGRPRLSSMERGPAPRGRRAGPEASPPRWGKALLDATEA
jgi:hypothetical protein